MPYSDQNGLSRHWLTLLLGVLIALTGACLREMVIQSKELAKLDAQLKSNERRIDEILKARR